MNKDNHTETPSYPGSTPMVKIDGGRVRHLRESKKLTQLYLSTVVGVTTDTISRWENRHYQSIKLENAEKLAQALEVPFEDILKQEEPDEKISVENVPLPETPQKITQQRYPRFIITLAVVLVSVVAGILLYSMISKQSAPSISAVRILPPHVSPGQTFPVLIKVSSQEEDPVSLIIKEVFPVGTSATQGIPAINSMNGKENSLKWIHRVETPEQLYAYLCKVPVSSSHNQQLDFTGSVTMKKVRDLQPIGGATFVAIAPFHWADSNRDQIIDDEEILAVYDTYSDIEELPFDRDLIDSIWASSGYAWDAAKEHFITID